MNSLNNHWVKWYHKNWCESLTNVWNSLIQDLFLYLQACGKAQQYLLHYNWIYPLPQRRFLFFLFFFVYMRIFVHGLCIQTSESQSYALYHALLLKNVCTLPFLLKNLKNIRTIVDTKAGNSGRKYIQFHMKQNWINVRCNRNEISITKTLSIKWKDVLRLQPLTENSKVIKFLFTAQQHRDQTAENLLENVFASSSLFSSS